MVARADATSSITNSKYYGTISLPEDSATSTTSTSQGNLFVGGIVAHTLGTVEGCTFGGTISHNATIRTVYIGGVTACCEDGSILKANNCNGTIAYNSPRKVAGLNDASRFNYSGGIVGQANGGEIDGNAFNGRITSTSSVKTVYLGGIVGRLYGGATVLKNNSTSRSSKIIMTGAARYTGLGGLVALVDANTGGYSLDFTNDTGSFEGMISGGSASDAFESCNCYMGGIIGESDANLTLVAPKWSGSIDVDHTADVTWYNLAAGGIVGAAHSQSVLKNADNYGFIKLDTKSEVRNTYYNVAGIVGHIITNVDVTPYVKSVTYCDNHGDVYTAEGSYNATLTMGGILSNMPAGMEFNNNTNRGEISNNGTKTGTIYLSGIVAYINESPVVNCTNYAPITNNAPSTTGLHMGGIVGHNSAAAITDCTNEVNAAITNNGDIAGNVYVAGITGIMRRTFHMRTTLGKGSITDKCLKMVVK